MSLKTKIFLGAGALLLLVLAFTSGYLFEYQDADKIMVVQSPSGTLTFYTEPGGGIKWQGFGRVTEYPRRGQFWFSSRDDQGADEKSKLKDQSIQVRFNDGGHGKVSGSMAWEMPIDNAHLIAIHTKYGNQDAIEQQLIRPTVEKAVYMSGPLMSSKESAAEKRTMLLSHIEDQVQHGVYKTETVSEKQKDAITGQDHTVNLVQLAKDKNGAIIRTDESPFIEFGIRTFNLALNEVKYDEAVEKQIADQQQLVMRVQTAIAESKTAEQAALTAEQHGKAEAAKAKWTQEVIKAQQVTEAQQKMEVAALDVKTAELRKREATLQGEGEGARRAAIQKANGSLELKLETYRQVHGYWADAFSKFQGDMVPRVIFGGTSGQSSPGNATDLVKMLTAKTAMDLGLNTQAQK